MKTSKFYIPFKFDLPDLFNGDQFYKKLSPNTVAFSDEWKAHQAWDDMKNGQGEQLSTFGCGQDLDQYVTLPGCTGMLHIDAPAGTIKDNQYPENINPEWITQLDIRIEGDVSHGPLIYSQLTMGSAPDYEDVQMNAFLRFQDLARICNQIAIESPATLMKINLYDEHARESLSAMYNSAGFTYKRQPFSLNMSPEQQALSFGLEYLQQYMKTMKTYLTLDEIIRHAHSLEQEFRDEFSKQYDPQKNFKMIAAAVVEKIMEDHCARGESDNERAVFTLLKHNAMLDAQECAPAEENADINNDELDEPDDR